MDLIIGNSEKRDIVDIIESYHKDTGKIDRIYTETNKNRVNLSDINEQKEYVEFGTTTYTEKTRAVIKIQDGCNNFCTYCIIPYAKGRVRSREPQSIIEEIKKVVNNGIKEVVLTGIHIASYGVDFERKYLLIDLLEEINKIEKLRRIRLRFART